VMAIGGFNGTDPAPTLAQFEGFIRSGTIHYFIASSGRTGSLSGGSTTTSAARITAWVQRHFVARAIGGVTVYDLTRASV
jgi:hypothetical protein